MRGSILFISVSGGLLLLFALLGIRWIHRYIFAPLFTNRARNAFITQVLAGSSFDVLKRDHWQEWEFEGRTVTAHWITRPAPPPSRGFVVEFDVHPSTHPWSFSKSTFISIEDEEHLSRMREKAKTLAHNGLALGSPLTIEEETNEVQP